jgi:hypothetical protein
MRVCAVVLAATARSRKHRRMILIIAEYLV